MKTYQVKAARYKTAYIVWFHLYEETRISKSIDGENGLGAIATKYGLLFWSDENVLKL